MKILVIGVGEAGKPILEILRGVHQAVESLDIEQKTLMFDDPDVVHICYPEHDLHDFIDTSVKYIDRFSPRLVLIESTVSPGVTLAIHKRLDHKPLMCHSPVRGNIAEGMKKGLLMYTKYIGPVDKESALEARKYYESAGIQTFVCRSPIETELAKLFETTYRGLMFAWFQEIHRICKASGADFGEVCDFIGSTEKEGKQPRPVFHPGVIGGHCILPNAEKLYKLYPTKFVEALLESNQRRVVEIAEEQSQRVSDART
jgi:UDP-N-acetyl-D-mannosaminuronate dehydrogenase